MTSDPKVNGRKGKTQGKFLAKNVLENGVSALILVGEITCSSRKIEGMLPEACSSLGKTGG